MYVPIHEPAAPRRGRGGAADEQEDEGDDDGGSRHSAWTQNLARLRTTVHYARSNARSRPAPRHLPPLPSSPARWSSGSCAPSASRPTSSGCSRRSACLAPVTPSVIAQKTGHRDHHAPRQHPAPRRPRPRHADAEPERRPLVPRRAHRQGRAAGAGRRPAAARGVPGRSNGGCRGRSAEYERRLAELEAALAATLDELSARIPDAREAPRRGQVPEAKIVETDAGAVVESEGWFVLNAADARWTRARGERAVGQLRGRRARLRGVRDRHPRAPAWRAEREVPRRGVPGGLPRPLGRVHAA